MDGITTPFVFFKPGLLYSITLSHPVPKSVLGLDMDIRIIHCLKAARDLVECGVETVSRAQCWLLRVHARMVPHLCTEYVLIVEIRFDVIEPFIYLSHRNGGNVGGLWSILDARTFCARISENALITVLE